MIGSSQRVCHVCKYTTRIFGVVQTTPHTHTGHTQTSRGIIEFDRMPKMQITTLHIMGLIQFSGTHEHTLKHCETSALCNVCTCPSTYSHTDAHTDNNCTQFASGVYTADSPPHRLVLIRIRSKHTLSSGSSSKKLPRHEPKKIRRSQMPVPACVCVHVRNSFVIRRASPPYRPPPGAHRRTGTGISSVRAHRECVIRKTQPEPHGQFGGRPAERQRCCCGCRFFPLHMYGTQSHARTPERERGGEGWEARNRERDTQSPQIAATLCAAGQSADDEDFPRHRNALRLCVCAASIMCECV